MVGRSGSGVTLILCLVGGGLGLAAVVQWVRVASQEDEDGECSKRYAARTLNLGRLLHFSER